jgi:1-acyl-sn-glycerol-3-phosphate acyltransferase
MRVHIAGRQGALAIEVARQLRERGHTPDPSAPTAIFFPGDTADLERIAGRCTRLVLRSHAGAYGANPKNPGMMDESRVSLLPAGDPAQLYLRAEEIALRHPNSAVVRLATVADAGEGDPLAAKLISRVTTRPAGRDPNVQFIGLRDAASALIAAAESNASGLFNAAGAGAVPLKTAMRAARATALPVPEVFGLKQLRYNWTISSERLIRETGWKPELTSLDAFRDLINSAPGSKPGLLANRYDDWGLNVDYIRAWGWWLAFLRKIYWRIDCEGMENIPLEGRGLFVSNHRGFMPLDAVMHLSLIFTRTGRVPRFLITHTLLRTPFLCNFLTKLGGVVASQENAARLFETNNLVGFFPEGIRGTFIPYKATYRLRDFTKSGFVKMAVENQSPVIPAAAIGHAEIFPIIGRIDSSWVVRELGWPYLPVAPPFPLAPVPIPSKWHVRILPAVPVDGLSRSDAGNEHLMRAFARHIQDIVQRNVDEMLSRRKHIFWGRVLNGVAAPSPAPFQKPVTRQASAASASAPEEAL